MDGIRKIGALRPERILACVATEVGRLTLDDACILIVGSLLWLGEQALRDLGRTSARCERRWYIYILESAGEQGVVLLKLVQRGQLHRGTLALWYTLSTSLPHLVLATQILTLVQALVWMGARCIGEVLSRCCSVHRNCRTCSSLTVFYFLLDEFFKTFIVIFNCI